MKGENPAVPFERIERSILLIRGQKVMLDRNLAALYDVPTKALKQAVRRNIERFPKDFMFVLSAREFANWRSQFVTSSSDRIGLRHAPMAFTEQGVAMLSSVLRSPRALLVNVEIMRAFVRLRRFLATHKALAEQLKELESRVAGHDEQIQAIFQAIRQLIAPPAEAERPSIGFRPAKAFEPKGVREGRSRYRPGRSRGREHKRKKSLKGAKGQGSAR
ncbi:MAG: ORF6N domain-containing protein [Candidatus Brocadiia bacterium]